MKRRLQPIDAPSQYGPRTVNRPREPRNPLGFTFSLDHLKSCVSLREALGFKTNRAVCQWAKRQRLAIYWRGRVPMLDVREVEAHLTRRQATRHEDSVGAA